MVPCPHCPPAARGLLALLLLLPVRGARGLCGAPPELSAAKPEPLNRARRELNPAVSPETDPAPAFPVGATVRYRCREGFIKIPGKSDTATCLPSSRWSNIDECCDRSCDVPPRLKSAVLVQKDADKSYYPVGTHVSYVCRPGYESAEATHDIACLENLTWSEAPEFCRGKSCGVPEGPENGRAADKTAHRFGARVEIICDDGFKLFGNPFIFCVRKDDHVEWSVLPTCQMINCSPPPNITNEVHNGSIIITQDKLRRVPLRGADGGGNPSGECGALQTLSHAVPADTDHTDGFAVNTTVKYRCRDGFVKIPGKPDAVVCLPNSEWSHIEEFCDRSCDVPPRLKSAVLVQKDADKSYYPVGTHVSYVCRPGYESAEATHNIACLENLTWSEAPEFCRGSCDVPPRLKSAVLVQKDADKSYYPVGTHVSYVCRPGYESAEATHNIACLENLTWSEAPEFCRGSCDVPPRLKSAVLVQKDADKSYYPVGTHVSYVCRPGYESAEATHNIACLENLTWSEAPEFCRGKSCGVPKGPENGRAADKTYHRFGARVEIICDDGFKLFGNPFIFCVRKDDHVEWSVLPTCQMINCSPPPNITNEVHNGSSTESFDYNSLVIESGMSMGTDAPIGTDAPTGMGAEATADADAGIGECGALQTLSHAVPADTDHTDGFAVNTTVKYRCRDGFVKIPGKPDAVVCLPNSEWSHIEEFCDRSCDVPPRLKSAVLVQKDADKSYYPVGTHVSYVCRPGYESAEATHNIACLENLTWSEAPEFCRGKSCGVPEGPENGRAADKTNHRFGARVEIICDDGFKLFGNPFIFCVRKDDHVEWSVLPTCQMINCSPPPNITSEVHNGSSAESFDYNSLVIESGMSTGTDAPTGIGTDTSTGTLIGIGIGIGIPIGFGIEECGALPRLCYAFPPDIDHTVGFLINTTVTYKCCDGFVKIPGKPDAVVCLSNSEWSPIEEFCGQSGMSTGTDAPTGIGTDTSTGTLIGIGIGIGIPIGFGIEECGALPRLCYAFPPDIDHTVGFLINTTVTYKCCDGFVKIPGKPDAVVCLSNSEWSPIEEFCGQSGMSTGTDAPTGIGTDTSTGTLIGIGIGIGIGIPIGFGIGFVCICFVICVRKKKKGSYNVDSLKTTLQQLSSQMSEKKTTGCSDSMSPEQIGLNV